MLQLLKWNDPNLKTITLLALYDVGDSYKVTHCEGLDSAGDTVIVIVPFSALPKRNLRNQIVAFAMRDKVYAVGLNIFEAIEITP